MGVSLNWGVNILGLYWGPSILGNYHIVILKRLACSCACVERLVTAIRNIRGAATAAISMTS